MDLIDRLLKQSEQLIADEKEADKGNKDGNFSDSDKSLDGKKSNEGESDDQSQILDELKDLGFGGQFDAKKFLQNI